MPLMSQQYPVAQPSQSIYDNPRIPTHSVVGFKNRLAELVRTSNMLIFWGRPIHELIAAAEMVSTNSTLLSSYKVEGRDYDRPMDGDDVIDNRGDSEVVIINVTDIKSHHIDEDWRAVTTGYCIYRIWNINTRIIYVTTDNEEQIKQWDLLRESPYPCKTVRFREPIPVEILHEFVEF